MKLSNKVILALYSPSNAHLRPSKLRIFGLRKIAIKPRVKRTVRFAEVEQSKARLRD